MMEFELDEVHIIGWTTYIPDEVHTPKKVLKRAKTGGEDYKLAPKEYVKGDEMGRPLATQFITQPKGK